MVRVRSLRTQQRAKSQCTCTTPVGGRPGYGLALMTDAKIVSMAGPPAGRDISYVSSPHGRSSERACGCI